MACGGGHEQTERQLDTESLSAQSRPHLALAASSPSASHRSEPVTGEGDSNSTAQSNPASETEKPEPNKRGEPNPNIPGNLWQPPAGSTPTSGSYVYLDSEPNDDVGRGVSQLYTPSNAVLSVRHGSRFGQGAFLGVSIKGTQQWEGDFQVSQLLSQVQMGHYVRLKQYPRHDPVFGGLSWSTEGRSCKLSNGWVTIDNIVLSGNQVIAVELRFEQVCHDSQGRLRGKIRWAAVENQASGQPTTPVPSGLWQPPAGAMPASGNALYLESDTQDFVAAGQRFLYTGSNTSIFNAYASSNGLLSIWVQPTGGQSWLGYFKPTETITRLEPGLYTNLPNMINGYSPVFGGYQMDGLGTGCHTADSWVAIDSVSYDADRMIAIELRFEQFCWKEGEGLRGAMRWAASGS